MAHFFYIHFAFPTNFRNVFEGHVATQFMDSTGRPDMAGEGYGDEDLLLESEATYFGPSFMINWLKTDYKGFDHRRGADQLPLPDERQLLRPAVRPEGAEARGRRREDHQLHRRAATATMFGEGFMQDVHIWLNKSPIQNPLLCEEDGPVYQLRRWYEQFYVDVADVTPEMTERFEFEVDTTQANEIWRARWPRTSRKKEARTRRPRDGGRRDRGRRGEKVGGPTAGAASDGLVRPAEPRDPRGPAPLPRGTPREVACLDCLATVGVRKNSEYHTSIQWSAESLAACAEFQKMRRRARRAAHVHASCSRLRSSDRRERSRTASRDRGRGGLT